MELQTLFCKITEDIWRTFLYRKYPAESISQKSDPLSLSPSYHVFSLSLKEQLEAIVLKT